MINTLRGEFEATLGGECIAFDTTLGTIAKIEDRCGDLPIVEIVNKAVFGRRAQDQMALVAAALATAGYREQDAETLAARSSVSEAEGFILALMGALGFEVVPRREASVDRPLAGASSGGVGASSPSAG